MGSAKAGNTRTFPEWLKQRVPGTGIAEATGRCVTDLGLNTVCENARCPNIGVCFGEGTATFMILGTICTRNCSFCAVTKGTPPAADPDEPRRIGLAVQELGLTHAVVTSVTRDDLPDGGAAHFAACVRSIRETAPQTTVEILVPDFSGAENAIDTAITSGPEVLNHNVETVPRLYGEVRPGACCDRSLALLRQASQRGVVTKSGLMLGLGETRDEVRQVMRDLLENGCDILTMGQYLAPTRAHFPVDRFVPPEEFARYERDAAQMGFRAAACAPLMRSSYMARELYLKAVSCRN